MALVHDQRRATERFEMHDVADEDRMIAAIMARDDLGSDRGARAAKHGRATCAQEIRGDVGHRSAGEMGAQPLLVLGQDADAEMPGFDEQRMDARTFCDGDDAQRRLERARHEGVGRHAADLAARLGGDHGDAGGERAHHPAEQHVIDQRGFLVVHRPRLPTLDSKSNRVLQSARGNVYTGRR